MNIILCGMMGSGKTTIGMNIIEYAALHSGVTEYRIVEYPYIESSMDKFLKVIEGGESTISLDPVEFIMQSYSYLKEQNKVEHLARVPYLYEFAY